MFNSASIAAPIYKFPLKDQNDYKARVYFTTIIEEPPTIDTSAFTSEMSDASFTNTLSNLGESVTARISGGKRFKGDTVKLYLPPAIQVQDGVNFENAELGVRGGAVVQGIEGGGETTLADVAKNTFALGSVNKIVAEMKNEDVARAVIAGVSSVSGRGQNIVNTALQTTLNPNIRAVFRSVNLREHSFAFKFVPRSQAEAQEVRGIVDWFRMQLYPESTAAVGGVKVAYKFPNKMLIRMKYGTNTDLVTQYLPAHLVNMTTNYNPSNMSFYYDGEFQEIDLTLNFREYRTLSAEDIRNGFNELDNPDEVTPEIINRTFPNNGPPGTGPRPASSISKGYPIYTAPKTREFIRGSAVGSPNWNQAQYEEASGIREANWGPANPVNEPGGAPLGVGGGIPGPYYDYDKSGPQ
jgi:hypothetical protein